MCSCQLEVLTRQFEQSLGDMTTKLVFHQGYQGFRGAEKLGHHSPLVLLFAAIQSTLHNICCAAILRVAEQVHTKRFTSLVPLFCTAELEDCLVT